MIRYTKINQPKKRSSIHKIDKDAYTLLNKDKFSVKGGNLGGARKSKKRFNWSYYKFFPATLTQPFIVQYTPYIKYINVGIVKCFDSISHKVILELTPLVSKYKFLLKS